MKYFTIIFIILTLFLQTNLVFGQSDNTSPVQFHGSNKLFGQYANRQGTNSQIRASFWRNDLNMTLTAYGIPISASFFLTSEQSDKRQSINNFRIYFNPKEFTGQKATAYAQSKTTAVMAKVLSLFSTLEVG